MAAESNVDLLEREFLKFKESLWASWAEFEDDFKKFEQQRTATAHRLERSDLVATINRRRELLGQTIIPESIKYTRAVFVCCHYGEFNSKSRGLHKCRR